MLLNLAFAIRLDFSHRSMCIVLFPERRRWQHTSFSCYISPPNDLHVEMEAPAAWSLSRLVTFTLEVTSNMQPLTLRLLAAACLDTTAHWWTDSFPVNTFRGLKTPGQRGARGCVSAIKERNQKKGRACVCACVAVLICGLLVNAWHCFPAPLEGHKWFIMRICTCDFSCVCKLIDPQIDLECFNYWSASGRGTTDREE